MAYATKYYSPRLDRALITRLYHEAKAQRIPMTVLTNRMVESALSRLYGADHRPERSIVTAAPSLRRGVGVTHPKLSRAGVRQHSTA